MAPALTQAVRRDPPPAFDAIYRRHVRDVYRLSLGILGNAHDAEDVTQVTFMRAYRTLEEGVKVENLRAWLLAIAHNTCRQRFRTAGRRPREVELQPEVVEAASDGDAPTAQEIRDAIKALAFNQRTVLVLREIAGLSYEEIAETMGLSLSAVETLLFRARRALREQLEAAEHALACDAVERLVSLELDQKLSRPDRRLLRAHLRSCRHCSRLALSQRLRKRAMPSLVAVPLPLSLTNAFPSGGSAAAVFLTSKAAAAVVSVALVTTGLVVMSVLPAPQGDSPEALARVADRSDIARSPTGLAVLDLPRAGRARTGWGLKPRSTKGREYIKDEGTGQKARPGRAEGSGTAVAASNGSPTLGGGVPSPGGGGVVEADADTSGAVEAGADASGAVEAGADASGGTQADVESQSAEGPVSGAEQTNDASATGNNGGGKNVVAAAHNMGAAAENVVTAAHTGSAQNVVPAAHSMVGAAQNVVAAAQDKSAP